MALSVGKKVSDVKGPQFYFLCRERKSEMLVKTGQLSFKLNKKAHPNFIWPFPILSSA